MPQAKQPPESPAPQLEELSAELLSRALREVRQTYRELNAGLFAGRLVLPHFEWGESERLWGAWTHATRSLSLSPRLLGKGWGELVEVLKHEMAHQYVAEVLGQPLGEGPHGAAFQKVCRERGIDSRAAADPSESREPGPEESRRQAVLVRIEHLLALAQSENQHEAENAMSTARRLMLKYNLSEGARSSTHSYRHVGKPTGRRQAWQRVLANVLSDYFFVEVIIVPVYRPLEGKRGSILELCGSPANLEIAGYAHDFLERSAHHLWHRHKKASGIRLDRDKQSFLYGVISGFAAKLEADSQKNQSEGLVWLGDPLLTEYFRARHPHVRRVSGRGKLRQDAFSAGHAAGERIVLHRGVEAGSTGGAPRLLGRGGKR